LAIFAAIRRVNQSCGDLRQSKGSPQVIVFFAVACFAAIAFYDF
jgi:hypothetical protein